MTERLLRLQTMGAGARRQFESSLRIEIAERCTNENRSLASIRYVASPLVIYPFRKQAFFRTLWCAFVRLARRR